MNRELPKGVIMGRTNEETLAMLASLDRLADSGPRMAQRIPESNDAAGDG